MRAHLRRVDEVGARQVVLLAVAVELPALLRTRERQVRGVAEPEVLGAVGEQREVVAEVTEARFEVQLVADGAVPFSLVDPAARVLVVGLAFVRVGVAGVRQTVGLVLLAPLVVADDLVVLVHLVGELAHRVPQLGVEGLVELEQRLRHRVLLRAVGAEPPDLVLLDRAAHVDGRVVVLVDLVRALAEAEAALRDRRRVLVGEVRALQRVVVPVEVVLTRELVAARLGDELALHAGVRHLGRLAGGAEEHFFERRVVEVETGAAGAFRRVDALDEHADLAGEAVGRVARLRAGAVAADVDTGHLHGRRHGEQRPHVAPVGDRLQLLGLEVLLNTGGRGVDDGRLAGDRDGLLQGRERQFDVQVGREAQRELDAFAPHRVESGQFVGHRPGARRQRREAVVTGLRRHRRLRTERRRAGGRHGHAGQHRALRVGDATLNRTSAACATALSERARGGHRGERHGEQPADPSLHSYPPWPVGAACGQAGHVTDSD